MIIVLFNNLKEPLAINNEKSKYFALLNLNGISVYVQCGNHGENGLPKSSLIRL